MTKRRNTPQRTQQHTTQRRTAPQPVSRRSSERSRRRPSRRAQAIAGVVLLGGSIIGIVATRTPPRSIPAAVAAIVPLDQTTRFTFVATATDGTPAIAAAGVLEPGARCTAAGRASVGAIAANPMSAPDDVDAALDRTEATTGVARIYDDGVEHVETPEGNDIGNLPLPWFEPQGATTSICEQIRATLTALDAIAAHDATANNIDAAIAAEDRRTGTQRWVAAWDTAWVQQQRIGGAAALDTRVELLTTADGVVRVVVRALRTSDAAPSTPVAGLTLQVVRDGAATGGGS
jgi:hypothetical protein